ncbi:MAG: endonuclease/exonuclease/phosphatase family protein [Nanoarchaeota archaeon]|nr:endonuclease/exonuclease/phosphatase family protein [Nanoarchaeota archaeon]
MRVAIYNQMFALNGNSFWATVMGHWAVHYQANPKEVWARTDISKTAETIAESKADIIGVIEVLEGQEKELIKKLRKIGYKYFYFGKGHKTKYNKLYVQELVASKIKGEQKETGEWPVEHRLGGGGGFVHIYYPEKKFHLTLVHLGLASRKYHSDQIKFLKDYLSKLKGKKIILGDFNISYKKLEPFLPDFNLVPQEIKSCSTTPIMKWFYNRDVDHILVRGFDSVGCESLYGVSDHKLIYADLK